MNENTVGKVLKTLPHKTREKLRRVVLVSQDDDNTIAEKVGCVSFHVMAMRHRLIALGVLVRPTIDPPPATAGQGQQFEVSQRGSVR